MQVDAHTRKRCLELADDLQAKLKYAPASVGKVAECAYSTLLELTQKSFHNTYGSRIYPEESTWEIPHARLPADLMGEVFKFAPINAVVNYSSTCKRAREVFLSTFIINRFFRREEIQKLNIGDLADGIVSCGKNIIGLDFKVGAEDLCVLEEAAYKYPKAFASITVNKCNIDHFEDYWLLASPGRIKVILGKNCNAAAKKGLEYLMQFPYDSRGVFNKSKMLTKKQCDQKINQLDPHAYRFITSLYESLFNRFAFHWSSVKPAISYRIHIDTYGVHSCKNLEDSPLKDALLGYTYYQESNPQKALKNFNQALEQDPTQPLALKWRGQMYLDQKKYTHALQDFELALEEMPDDCELLIDLAKVYEHFNDQEKRRNVINKAIELEPENADAYYQRARLYYDQYDYEKAIQEINQALAVDPNDPDFKNMLGLCYYEANQLKNALQIQNTLCNSEDIDSACFYNRSRTHFQLGNYNAAHKDINTYLNENPRDLDALMWRAKTYYELERYDEAIQDCDQMIHRNPEDHEAYYERAWALYHKGNYQSSLRDINFALQKNPDFDELYYLRAANHDNLGNYEEALQNCEKALELSPNRAKFKSLQGSIKQALGRHDEAIEEFETALTLDPKDGLIYMWYVECLIEQGKVNQAWERLKQGLKEAIEDKPLLYSSRALLQAMQGNYKAAYLDISRECKHIEGNSFLLARKGRIKWMQGLPDQALEHYKKALAIDPHSPEVKKLGKLMGAKMN